MKILMITRAAGPLGILEPGRRYDLPEAEAQSLLAGRYARPVGPGEDRRDPKPDQAERRRRK